MSPKAKFSALYSLSCTNTAQCSHFISFFKSPSLRRWHNFSSPSIHQISTPTSLSYKTLYHRSRPGWLPIFSLSTLQKLNFFLLDLNINSLKYTAPLSLQPTPLATMALFLTNTSPYRIKSMHFVNLAIITFMNFAVSAHILILKQPARLSPPTSILNLTTVIL